MDGAGCQDSIAEAAEEIVCENEKESAGPDRAGMSGVGKIY